jgi:hypothetical protein
MTFWRLLPGARNPKDRIQCVLEKLLELLEPNRKFCAALLRHAPDGADPLSPFSGESRRNLDLAAHETAAQGRA